MPLKDKIRVLTLRHRIPPICSGHGDLVRTTIHREEKVPTLSQHLPFTAGHVHRRLLGIDALLIQGAQNDFLCLPFA